MRHRLLGLFLAGLISGANAASEDQKSTSSLPTYLHALVVGNESYPVGRLTNPANDAREIGRKLRSIGFNVTTIIDGSRLHILWAVDSLSKSLSERDVVVFFYAGNGFTLEGVPHLLPTDLGPSEEVEQLQRKGIPLLRVSQSLAAAGIRLFLFDADLASLHRDTSRQLLISSERGSLFSFSSAVGLSADDGQGSKNSPFTRALLEHLSDPVDIAVVLRKVREKVMKATGGKQQPWEYGSLTGGELILSAIKR